MAAIELAPEAAGDFDRILDHLERHAAHDPERRIRDIIEAIDVLAHSPRLGRPVRAGKFELIIGRRERGYVALYRYVEVIDTVFILAIRIQREAGYPSQSADS